MKLEWSRLAFEDRDRIFDWLVQQSASVAVAMDTHIEVQTQGLLRFPASGRLGRVLHTRELVISHSPYVAVYRIRGTAVRILRILHTSQNWP